jgi:hypothetical protein
MRRGPAVRVPFVFRSRDGQETSSPNGKPSWADALSRIALTHEVIVVMYPRTGDDALDRLSRKRVRASINRSALRRMALVHIDHDADAHVLVVRLASMGGNT